MAALVQYLDWIASPGDGERSAIAHSGPGAGRLLLGRPAEALPALEQARREREAWPEAVRASLWADDACDLYLLALAEQELARLDPSLPAGPRAREHFEQAEELVGARPLPWEQSDILLRLRERARQALAGG